MSRSTIKRLALIQLFIIATATDALAVDWHHPLYLSGGGWWRQRIRVVVHNDSDRPLEGRPVGILVGNEKGQAALADLDWDEPWALISSVAHSGTRELMQRVSEELEMLEEQDQAAPAAEGEPVEYPEEPPV